MRLTNSTPPDSPAGFSTWPGKHLANPATQAQAPELNGQATLLKIKSHLDGTNSERTARQLRATLIGFAQPVSGGHDPLKPLHVRAFPVVIKGVRLIAASLLCAWSALPCSARDLAEVLRNVETRYNSARTLEVRFEQRWLAGGRPRRAESGTLKLLKPGRMRWDYASPPGKLFLSDGKTLWYASPATGRVERAAMKNTDDFRTPLAFLLGRLNFKKSFQDFELRENDAAVTILAIPKGAGMPYSKVEFTVTPANEITRLLVTGLDETVMEFRFSSEKLNAAVDSRLFRYTPPAGVEVVEVKGFGETEAGR